MKLWQGLFEFYTTSLSSHEITASENIAETQQTDLLKKYSIEVGVEGINVDFLPSKDCSEDVCEGGQGLSTEQLHKPSQHDTVHENYLGKKVNNEIRL